MKELIPLVACLGLIIAMIYVPILYLLIGLILGLYALYKEFRSTKEVGTMIVLSPLYLLINMFTWPWNDRELIMAIIDYNKHEK